jgi:hypothetical protein
MTQSRRHPILIHSRCSDPKDNRPVVTYRNLKRDIIVILSIKLSIVLAAALFVFGPHQRPHVDIDAIQHRILNLPNS